MTTNASIRQSGSLRTTVTATGNGTYDLNPAMRAGLTILRLQLLGGGLGAGSGRKGAAGTARCAGGPGGCGAYVDTVIPISVVMGMFPTGLIPYNIGPGTTGGAAVTTDDTNGNAGAAGVSAVNNTWFGADINMPTSIAVARAGATSGGGGTATTGATGTSFNGTAPAPVGTSASTVGGFTVIGSGSPGVGGGITSGDVPAAGTTGGTPIWWAGVRGTAGVVGGATPTSGTSVALSGWGPTPGGGAASITTNAQAGASAAANSGMGGASGGASLNGASKNSGAGGDGGSGFLRITAMP